MQCHHNTSRRTHSQIINIQIALVCVYRFACLSLFKYSLTYSHTHVHKKRDLNTICHSLHPHTHSCLFPSSTSSTHCPFPSGQLLWQQGCVCLCVYCMVMRVCVCGGVRFSLPLNSTFKKKLTLQGPGV